MYGSGNTIDNYADNIVMNSFRLAPKVAEIEMLEIPTNKLQNAKSLQFLIDLLYQDCVKLESTRAQGKDFVRMLRKELKKLRYIYKTYVNTIV